jgi:hypothetical protein
MQMMLKNSSIFSIVFNYPKLDLCMLRNISTDKTVIATDKPTCSYSAAPKNNSESSSSFESILNQQVNNSSASSAVNHPKIASTGVSNDMPKEYRDRKLAEMEYNIAHGHTEDMQWTENGYIPKSYSLSSSEYYAVKDRLEAYYQTPAGQKSHLMFGNPAVKAIVQDKEGNIVAKFYVDNMSGADPLSTTVQI